MVRIPSPQHHRWCLCFDGAHLVSHSLIRELVSELMFEVLLSFGYGLLHILL